GVVEGSSMARPPTWPVWRELSSARNCVSTLVSWRIRTPARCYPKRPCGTRRSVELEEHSVGPGVDEPGLAEPGFFAGGVVDVAEHGQARALLLDRREDRLAAEMPAERPIEVALGRRVDDEHTTLGAAGQLGGGLLLGQVEAPRPRRRGDAAPDPVERNTVDVCPLAVEYGRRRPAGARLAQLLVGLAVAR